MPVISLLLALAAPLLLLPIEFVLPLPHLIEELTKAVLVFLLLSEEKKTRHSQLTTVVAAGLLFTFSETMLYLTNFLLLGSGEKLLLRLLVTGSLHLGTMLLIYFSGRRHWSLGVIGLVTAIAIHYYFNFFWGLRLS